MITITEENKRTRDLIVNHLKSHPKSEAEDLFKFIFQSSFGCEHLVTDEASALEYIKREYENLSIQNGAILEKLDGDYSRVNLTAVKEGLSPETLAKLFVLSAVTEEQGKALVEKKTEVLRKLVLSGELHIADFESKLAAWKAAGYPALHHSNTYRNEYRPAYRVIANAYADFIDVFIAIDRLLLQKPVILVIEGGSASGKSTLSDILAKVYDCNVIHMDDFFLRPEQRTKERFFEVGGNIDRERFSQEVVAPLKRNETVRYRPFDCSTFTLGEEITLAPKRLTVIEGVYSMHQAFGEYYNLSVFLDISPEEQRARILKRNTEKLAKRFFEEWIPLENKYFEGMRIKAKSQEIIAIK